MSGDPIKHYPTLAAYWLVGPLGGADLENLKNAVALVVAEMRVPTVEDQQHAGLIAVVPCLMLNGFVEHESFTFAPLPRFAADTKPAFFRHDQWQVDDRPNIGDAGMWRDGLARFEDRKEDRGRPVPYARVKGRDPTSSAVRGARSQTASIRSPSRHRWRAPQSGERSSALHKLGGDPGGMSM